MSRNPTYNVVLNTLNSTLDTLANNNSNKSYYVDWSSRMPQGKYRLSFTFQAEANKVIDLTTIPVVYSDIVSSSSNSILPEATVYQNTNILGVLHPQVIHQSTNSCGFRATLDSNPPIYLNNRPFNNLFTVQILNNSVPPVAYLDEAGTPANIGTYMLILHFELIQEYK